VRRAQSGEGVRRFRSDLDYLRRFSGVGVRFTPTFTPSSVFFRELDGSGRSIAPERIWAITLPQHPSPRLRTPPNRHLPPSNPLSAPFGQMLALGDQTLMNRTGQHRDAVPAHLVAEVLTGDADST